MLLHYDLVVSLLSTEKAVSFCRDSLVGTLRYVLYPPFISIMPSPKKSFPDLRMHKCDGSGKNAEFIKLKTLKS